MLVPVHHGHEGGQEPRRVTKRIMVVGITGAGKTSLVRTITGDRDFQGQTSMASHTSGCAASMRRSDDLDLVVVDTPGFFDTSRPWQESLNAIAGALLAPSGGFDMILFVVKASGRFTDEQHAAFSYMCNELFGAECLPHVVLAVTAAAGMTAEQVVREASQDAKLRDVVEAVEGRVLLFESSTRKPEDLQMNEAAVSAMLAHLRALPGPYDFEAFRRFRASAGELLVRPGESINDAVKNAKPGQTIRLAPGLYVEMSPVIVGKGVHIVGPREAFLDTHGYAGNVLCGLRCTGPASPSVKGITIINSIGHGILIDSGSRASIENCDVSGKGTYKSCGILVLGNGLPHCGATLRGNRVHGFDYGTWFDASTGVIENNELFDFAGTYAGGVYVWNGADVVVRGNQMRNMRLGVDVKTGGKGSFEGNTLEGVKRAVDVAPDSTGFQVGTNTTL